MSRVIGIDLGTTNSAVSFMDAGEPRLIPNDRGHRLTPSVVAFNSSGEVLVGESAKNQAVVNASRTIMGVKRSMGSQKLFMVGENAYSPEQISSFILSKLKADAERFLGVDIRQAVITVPAHFGERQRKATQEAGRLAGIRVRRVLNEPTAAALAYAFRSRKPQRLLVYDLGGGTFDVTCLAREDDAYLVRSTLGENHLGGMDFDRLLLERVLEAFEAESGMSIADDPMLVQQLTDMVERAKIELSNQNTAVVSLPFVGGKTPRHLHHEISREELNSLIRPLLDKTIERTRAALAEAKLDVSEIDGIVLAGGSSRIPLVRHLLEKELGLAEVSMVNPDEIVALGAGVQAGLLAESIAGEGVRDVTGFSLGVEVATGEFVTMLPKNSEIPSTTRRTFTTVADNQESVEIHVLQGESSAGGDRLSLGRFLLSGIRQGKRGQAQIEVTFGLDVDGIASVTARDADTGAEQEVTVTPVVDAEAFGNDPARDSRARLRSLLARTETLLGQCEQIVDEEFQRDISSIVSSARKALQSGRKNKLRESETALEAIIGELNAYLRRMETEHAGA